MTNLKSKLLVCLALLPCLHLFAQTAPAQNSVKLFFEKAFIHTDRSTYAPGENIWYKAYVINARDNHLISTSKNLYVELIAPADTIVNKQILNISSGTGKGDFTLPDRLPAGNYRLRAYTNWMRNFGDNFVFEKTIYITGGNQPADKEKNKTATASAGKSNNNIADAGMPVIRFFPEGGSLINDVTGIIAVKAENSMGKGIALSAPVISAGGDTVARFTCDTLGMGLFSILPIAGQTYHSVIKYNGQSINTPLPAPLNSGLSMRAFKRDTLIYITISCSGADTAVFAHKILSLNAKHTGTTYFTQQIKLNGTQATLKVPESILPEGIAIFTLYDDQDQHKPYCERLMYVDRPASAKLSVSMAKNIYQSREKVTVNISAKDQHNKPLSGTFSMSAFDAGLNPAESGNIKAFVMLQSEVRGQIEHAERYFDTTNVNRAKQLDMLLLTQGWRNFVWQRLADTSIKISYLPEQGFTISGTVKKEAGNKPIAGSNITLNLPKGEGSKLFIAQTNAAGNFFFDNIPLFGSQNIRLTTKDKNGEANGMIDMDSLFKHGLPVAKEHLLPPPAISDEVTAEMLKRSASNKSLDSVINLKEVKVQASNNIRFRDQTAQTAGYKDEVFNVSSADLSFKTLGQYILYMSKQAKPDPNSDQIVFYADGKTYKPRIILNNQEAAFNEESDDDIQAHYYTEYYNLPINQIETVVIKRLLAGLKVASSSRLMTNTTANLYGGSVKGAGIPPGPENLFVIYLTLKPGAMLRNGGGVTTANLQGYYEARDFYRPLYTPSNSNSKKPDLRTTIDWEPEIKTDANGQATVSFYNGDSKSRIRIAVNGITDSGEPLNATKNYTVK